MQNAEGFRNIQANLLTLTDNTISNTRQITALIYGAGDNANKEFTNLLLNMLMQSPEGFGRIQANLTVFGGLDSKTKDNIMQSIKGLIAELETTSAKPFDRLYGLKINSTEILLGFLMADALYKNGGFNNKLFKDMLRDVSIDIQNAVLLVRDPAKATLRVVISPLGEVSVSLETTRDNLNMTDVFLKDAAGDVISDKPLDIDKPFNINGRTYQLGDKVIIIASRTDKLDSRTGEVIKSEYGMDVKVYLRTIIGGQTAFVAATISNQGFYVIEIAGAVVNSKGDVIGFASQNRITTKELNASELEGIKFGVRDGMRYFEFSDTKEVIGFALTGNKDPFGLPSADIWETGTIDGKKVQIGSYWTRDATGSTMIVESSNWWGTTNTTYFRYTPSGKLINITNDHYSLSSTIWSGWTGTYGTGGTYGLIIALAVLTGGLAGGGFSFGSAITAPAWVTSFGSGAIAVTTKVLSSSIVTATVKASYIGLGAGLGMMGTGWVLSKFQTTHDFGETFWSVGTKVALISGIVGGTIGALKTILAGRVMLLLAGVANDMAIGAGVSAVADTGISLVRYSFGHGRLPSETDIVMSAWHGAVLAAGLSLGIRLMGAALINAGGLGKWAMEGAQANNAALERARGIAAREGTAVPKLTGIPSLAARGTVGAKVLNFFPMWAQSSLGRLLEAGTIGGSLITLKGILGMAVSGPFFQFPALLKGDWETFLASPFEMAKMGIWLTPLLGMFQAPLSMAGALHGATGRLTAAIEGFATRHGFSGVYNFAKTLIYGIAKETAGGAAARGSTSVLERLTASIGKGILHHIDSAAFVGSTLATVEWASHKLLTLSGMNEEGAKALSEKIAFAALFFLPGMGRSAREEASAGVRESATRTAGTRIFQEGADRTYFGAGEARGEVDRITAGTRAVRPDAEVKPLLEEQAKLRDRVNSGEQLDKEGQARLQYLDQQLGVEREIAPGITIREGGWVVGQTQLRAEADMMAKHLTIQARGIVAQQIAEKRDPAELALMNTNPIARDYLPSAIARNHTLDGRSVDEVASYDTRDQNSGGLTLRLGNGREITLNREAACAVKDSFIAAIRGGDAVYATAFAPVMREYQGAVDATRAQAEPLFTALESLRKNPQTKSAETAIGLRQRAAKERAEAERCDGTADALKTRGGYGGEIPQIEALRQEATQHRSEAQKLDTAAEAAAEITMRMDLALSDFNAANGTRIERGDTRSVDSIAAKMLGSTWLNYTAGRVAVLGFLSAHPDRLGNDVVTTVLQGTARELRAEISDLRKQAAETSRSPAEVKELETKIGELTARAEKKEARGLRDVAGFEGVALTEGQLLGVIMPELVRRNIGGGNTDAAVAQTAKYLYGLQKGDCARIRYNDAEIALGGRAQETLRDMVEQGLGQIIPSLQARLETGSMNDIAHYNTAEANSNPLRRGFTDSTPPTLRFRDGTRWTLNDFSARELKEALRTREGSTTETIGKQEIIFHIADSPNNFVVIRGNRIEIVTGQAVNAEDGMKVTVVDKNTGEEKTVVFEAGKATVQIDGNEMRLVRSSGKYDRTTTDVLFNDVVIARRGADGNWKPEKVAGDSVKEKVSVDDILKTGSSYVEGALGSVRTPLGLEFLRANRQGLERELRDTHEFLSPESARHYADQVISEYAKGIIGDMLTSKGALKEVLADGRGGIGDRGISGERGLVEEYCRRQAADDSDPNFQRLFTGDKGDLQQLKSTLAKQLEGHVRAELGRIKADETIDQTGRVDAVATIFGVSGDAKARLARTDASGKTLADDIIDLAHDFDVEKSIGLRSGQIDTVKVFLEEMAGAGRARIFVKNPTAAGKTIANIFLAKLMVARGEQVDIFLPNDPLVKQFFEQKIPAATGLTNRGLLEMSFGEGAGRGVIREGTTAMRFDAVIERYNRGEITADQMKSILEKTPVLVYTEKSLFLRQQALMKGDIQVMEALDARTKRTNLVIDEGHLYMKNVMDLIMSGKSKPISGAEIKLFEETFTKLAEADLVVRDASGNWRLDTTKLKELMKAETADQPHMAFREEVRTEFAERGINVAVAESIISGMKAKAEGHIAVDASLGVKPISELTGQTERSRQFQDVQYILGAGRQGGLAEESLYRAAAQSKTSSAEGLFTIINRYSKIIAASGTPPGDAILSLWGFGEAKNLGFKGGVEARFEHVDGKEGELPKMAELSWKATTRNSANRPVVVVHDNVEEAAAEVRAEVARQGGDVNDVIIVPEEGIGYLAEGGYKGKIFITNRIALLGVDFQTDLILITTGRMAESLKQQGNGRLSRNQEYGEFIVVTDRAWTDQQSGRIKELIGSDWRANDNLPSNIRETLTQLQAVETASDPKAELAKYGAKDVNDIKLKLVEQYMDAKAEGGVYVQTVTQYMRDFLIERMSPEEAKKFNEVYFDKETEVRREGAYQTVEAGRKGFGGADQLRTSLEITVEALKRTLSDARFDIAVKERFIDQLTALDVSGRRTINPELKSLQDVASFQDIVDVGFRHAEKIVPVDILFAEGKLTIGSVQRVARQQGTQTADVYKQANVAPEAADRMGAVAAYLTDRPETYSAGIAHGISAGVLNFFATKKDDEGKLLSVSDAATQMWNYTRGSNLIDMVKPGAAAGTTVSVEDVRVFAADAQMAPIFEKAGYNAAEAGVMAEMAAALPIGMRGNVEATSLQPFSADIGPGKTYGTAVEAAHGVVAQVALRQLLQPDSGQANKMHTIADVGAQLTALGIQETDPARSQIMDNVSAQMAKMFIRKVENAPAPADVGRRMTEIGRALPPDMAGRVGWDSWCAAAVYSVQHSITVPVVAQQLKVIAALNDAAKDGRAFTLNQAGVKPEQSQGVAFAIDALRAFEQQVNHPDLPEGTLAREVMGSITIEDLNSGKALPQLVRERAIGLFLQNPGLANEALKPDTRVVFENLGLSKREVSLLATIAPYGHNVMAEASRIMATPNKNFTQAVTEAAIVHADDLGGTLTAVSAVLGGRPATSAATQAARGTIDSIPTEIDFTVMSYQRYAATAGLNAQNAEVKAAALEAIQWHRQATAQDIMALQDRMGAAVTTLVGGALTTHDIKAAVKSRLENTVEQKLGPPQAAPKATRPQQAQPAPSAQPAASGVLAEPKAPLAPIGAASVTQHLDNLRGADAAAADNVGAFLENIASSGTERLDNIRDNLRELFRTADEETVRAVTGVRPVQVMNVAAGTGRTSDEGGNIAVGTGTMTPFTVVSEVRGITTGTTRTAAGNITNINRGSRTIFSVNHEGMLAFGGDAGLPFNPGRVIFATISKTGEATIITDRGNRITVTKVGAEIRVFAPAAIPQPAAEGETEAAKAPQGTTRELTQAAILTGLHVISSAVNNGQTGAQELTNLRQQLSPKVNQPSSPKANLPASEAGAPAPQPPLFTIKLDAATNEYQIPELTENNKPFSLGIKGQAGGLRLNTVVENGVFKTTIATRGGLVEERSVTLFQNKPGEISSMVDISDPTQIVVANPLTGLRYVAGTTERVDLGQISANAAGFVVVRSGDQGQVFDMTRPVTAAPAASHSFITVGVNARMTAADIASGIEIADTERTLLAIPTRNEMILMPAGHAQEVAEAAVVRLFADGTATSVNVQRPFNFHKINVEVRAADGSAKPETRDAVVTSDNRGAPTTMIELRSPEEGGIVVTKVVKAADGSYQLDKAASLLVDVGLIRGTVIEDGTTLNLELARGTSCSITVDGQVAVNDAVRNEIGRVDILNHTMQVIDTANTMEINTPDGKQMMPRSLTLEVPSGATTSIIVDRPEHGQEAIIGGVYMYSAKAGGLVSIASIDTRTGGKLVVRNPDTKNEAVAELPQAGSYAVGKIKISTSISAEDGAMLVLAEVPVTINGNITVAPIKVRPEPNVKVTRVDVEGQALELARQPTQVIGTPEDASTLTQLFVATASQKACKLLEEGWQGNQPVSIDVDVRNDAIANAALLIEQIPENLRGHITQDEFAEALMPVLYMNQSHVQAAASLTAVVMARQQQAAEAAKAPPAPTAKPEVVPHATTDARTTDRALTQEEFKKHMAPVYSIECLADGTVIMGRKKANGTAWREKVELNAEDSEKWKIISKITDIKQKAIEEAKFINSRPELVKIIGGFAGDVYLFEGQPDAMPMLSDLNTFLSPATPVSAPTTSTQEAYTPQKGDYVKIKINGKEQIALIANITNDGRCILQQVANGKPVKGARIEGSFKAGEMSLISPLDAMQLSQAPAATKARDTGLVSSEELGRIYSAEPYGELLQSGRKLGDEELIAAIEARAAELRQKGDLTIEQTRELDRTIKELSDRVRNPSRPLIKYKKQDEGDHESRSITVAKLRQLAGFLVNTVRTTKKFEGKTPVFLARDGALFHFIRDALRIRENTAPPDSTIYYISRPTLGEARHIVADIIDAVTNNQMEQLDSVRFTRYFVELQDRETFKKRLEGKYGEQWEHMYEEFMKAVGTVKNQLKTLGIAGKDIMLADSGFVGTLPLFIQGVVAAFPEDFPNTSVDFVFLSAMEYLGDKTFEYGGDAENETEAWNNKSAQLGVLEYSMHHEFYYDGNDVANPVKQSSPADLLKAHFERLLLVNAVLDATSPAALAPQPSPAEQITDLKIRIAKEQEVEFEETRKLDELQERLRALRATGVTYKDPRIQELETRITEQGTVVIQASGRTSKLEEQLRALEGRASGAIPEGATPVIANASKKSTSPVSLITKVRANLKGYVQNYQAACDTGILRGDTADLENLIREGHDVDALDMAHSIATRLVTAFMNKTKTPENGQEPDADELKELIRSYETLRGLVFKNIGRFEAAQNQNKGNDKLSSIRKLMGTLATTAVPKAKKLLQPGEKVSPQSKMPPLKAEDIKRLEDLLNIQLFAELERAEIKGRIIQLIRDEEARAVEFLIKGNAYEADKIAKSLRAFYDKLTGKGAPADIVTEAYEAHKHIEHRMLLEHKGIVSQVTMGAIREISDRLAKLGKNLLDEKTGMPPLIRKAVKNSGEEHDARSTVSYVQGALQSIIAEPAVAQRLALVAVEAARERGIKLTTGATPAIKSAAKTSGGAAKASPAPTADNDATARQAEAQAKAEAARQANLDEEKRAEAKSLFKEGKTNGNNFRGLVELVIKLEQAGRDDLVNEIKGMMKLPQHITAFNRQLMVARGNTTEASEAEQIIAEEPAVRSIAGEFDAIEEGLGWAEEAWNKGQPQEAVRPVQQILSNLQHLLMEMGRKDSTAAYDDLTRAQAAIERFKKIYNNIKPAMSASEQLDVNRILGVRIEGENDGLLARAAERIKKKTTEAAAARQAALDKAAKGARLQQEEDSRVLFTTTSDTYQEIYGLRARARRAVASNSREIPTMGVEEIKKALTYNMQKVRTAADELSEAAKKSDSQVVQQRAKRAQELVLDAVQDEAKIVRILRGEATQESAVLPQPQELTQKAQEQVREEFTARRNAAIARIQAILEERSAARKQGWKGLVSRVKGTEEDAFIGRLKGKDGKDWKASGLDFALWQYAKDNKLTELESLIVGLTYKASPAPMGGAIAIGEIYRRLREEIRTQEQFAKLAEELTIYYGEPETLDPADSMAALIRSLRVVAADPAKVKEFNDTLDAWSMTGDATPLPEHAAHDLLLRVAAAPSGVSMPTTEEPLKSGDYVKVVTRDGNVYYGALDSDGGSIVHITPDQYDSSVPYSSFNKSDITMSRVPDEELNKRGNLSTNTLYGHGTNGYILMQAVQMTNAQLRPSNDLPYVPLTGESGGTTHLNEDYVSTVSFDGANSRPGSVWKYADLSAGPFRLTLDNIDGKIEAAGRDLTQARKLAEGAEGAGIERVKLYISEKENRLQQLMQAKETLTVMKAQGVYNDYLTLSRIPIFIVGEGICRGSVRSDIGNEAVFRRVNIRVVGVRGNENVKLVQGLLSKAGAGDIFVVEESVLESYLQEHIEFTSVLENRRGSAQSQLVLAINYPEFRPSTNIEPQLESAAAPQPVIPASPATIADTRTLIMELPTLTPEGLGAVPSESGAQPAPAPNKLELPPMQEQELRPPARPLFVAMANKDIAQTSALPAPSVVNRSKARRQSGHMLDLLASEKAIGSAL